MTEGKKHADAVEWSTERMDDYYKRCPTCGHQSKVLHRCERCGRDLADEGHKSAGQFDE